MHESLGDLSHQNLFAGRYLTTYNEFAQKYGWQETMLLALTNGDLGSFIKARFSQ